MPPESLHTPFPFQILYCCIKYSWSWFTDNTDRILHNDKSKNTFSDVYSKLLALLSDVMHCIYHLVHFGIFLLWAQYFVYIILHFWIFFTIIYTANYSYQSIPTLSYDTQMYVMSVKWWSREYSHTIMFNEHRILLKCSTERLKNLFVPHATSLL